jgi:hypothetical protein
MNKVSGLEAIYRDYAPKKVQFYFVYKALAHPERNGILQPITLEERLLQAREAPKRLGNTIPFLVDAIDNRLKHELGDRNNSEFIVDPEGKIVRKRTWSDPEQVRKDLEVLVGKVDKITKPEDLILKVGKVPASVAAKGVIQKIPRTGLSAIVAEPRIEKGSVFYAKLRAEAATAVIEGSKGKLYLGFHLDPFLGAHWNNLKKPLRFELEIPDGVKLSMKSGESPKLNVEKDVDPREFLLDVEAWPENKTVRLTVTYAACTDDACHEVSQVYELRRQSDRDGGRAVSGGGFRGRSPEEIVKQLMEGDKNKDGKLTKDELPLNLQSRFEEFDLNKDGILDKDEIQKMAEKLSERKRP